MQITKGEKFRLGLFIAIIVGLLAIILFYMVGKRLVTKTDPYSIRFSESVDGLMPGANVKLNGVNIGRVTQIEVDLEDVRKVIVGIAVKHKTPIKKDMVANLVGGLSITGIKTIELSGGTHQAENLAVGSIIPEGVSQLKMLTGQAEAIALKFETLLNNLLTFTDERNQILVSQGLASFNSLTQRVDTLLADNSDLLVNLTEDVNKSVKQFQNVAYKMDVILGEFQKRNPGKKLGETLEEFHNIAVSAKEQVGSADLAKTLDSFQKAADKINELAGKMTHTINIIQEDLTTSMKNMKETSENMEDFSRIIKDNPSLLLRSGDKRERER